MKNNIRCISLFIIMFFIIGISRVYAVKLYFDDDGNFVRTSSYQDSYDDYFS